MSNLTTKEVLIKAKELISSPESWTQNVYKTATDSGKVCYCALGAISEVAKVEVFSSNLTPAANLLKSVVKDQLGSDESFAVYNDSHTHEDVMAVFDRAIEIAGLVECS